MTFLANIIWGGIAFLAGGLLGYWLFRWQERQRQQALQLEKKSILDNARRETEAMVREARIAAAEDLQRQRQETEKVIAAQRQETEKVIAARRQEINGLEQRLTQRDTLINRQLEGLVQQEQTLREQNTALKQREVSLNTQAEEVERHKAHWRHRLLDLAHLTEAEARAQVLKEIEQSSLKDAADLVRHILDTARSTSEDQARRIVSMAIQRYAGEHSFETTTAAINLPNEEIKGRIIGREGRNIRAFEAATGVTVLIDDTPNAVVLSSFDPVRREIAREAMQRLILDGRIHPTRIEEVTAKVSQEIDETIGKAGEEAVFKVGLPPLHPEIVRLLGRLKYRHSFSQNILDHSMEVAFLAATMAGELGLDIMTAKRAGLLHDIGKAVNHEVEGAHAIIGADLVKRYGESDEVVNSVAAHHHEVPPTYTLAAIVSAADAMSASRPGARSETMATYLKRLEGLEKIGMAQPGVEKCYAVQAGRELRVLVQPDQTTEDQAFMLARQLAHRIEDELQYPGQIRITVIRETRCVEFAK